MLNRVVTLIIKELQLLLSEKTTRAIIIGPVILQVLLFPFAATLDVTNTTVAIYSEDSGYEAIELSHRLSAAQVFSNTLAVQTPSKVESVIEQKRALLSIRIPSDFSRKLVAGQSISVQLIMDGRRSNSAQIAASYAQQIIENYITERRTALNLPNNSTFLPLQPTVRHWFNPNLNYKWFIVPSLVVMTSTIGVILLSALSIAREREHGTLDQLLVSPLTHWQIFIGKAIPAQIIAIIQASIVLLFGIFAFGIPFSGSLTLFYLLMLFYSATIAAYGMLLSALCNTQQQAFFAAFALIMPAILLSGYTAPVENMPALLQHFTWLNPMRIFMDITKQIYLKEATFSVIWPTFWPLSVLMITVGMLAFWLFKRSM